MPTDSDLGTEIAINRLQVDNLVSHFAVQWLRRGAVLLVGVCFLANSVKAQLGTLPVIAVQPLGISVQEGGDAVFSVVAVSASKMDFTWKRNGNNVGSNSSFLVLKNVDADDAGSYSVTIRNSVGTVVSSNATLLVLSDPRSLPLNLERPAISSNRFHLRLTGPKVASYIIYQSSNMVDWVSVATNFTTNGTVTFTDTNVLNRAFQYYRAEVQAK